jgi:hypothetical protein
MGIPPDHIRTLLSAQLVEHIQRCAGLHMPACPCMPQVMPPKVSMPALRSAFFHAAVFTCLMRSPLKVRPSGHACAVAS